MAAKQPRPVMDTAAAIQAAIDEGAQHGLARLNLWQQTVFLVAEAELLADMGAEFCSQYPADTFADTFAAAFRRIGAQHIAGLFTRLATHPHDTECEQRLAAALSNREGYNYQTLTDYVVSQQKAT
ncbi:hypothetical protein H9Q10_07060 [Eikenella sp. S3360]|uniref:DUF4375 domain-containing protein n=1 Tax=Eikenella glucosivorans TaxID=2766967 RepID=A0ABS0NAS2_9NEIS|nr:hypothetical protein [Eikenella glucosivorans]MBH5329423.1 hypothetical protein [Eikenella glucosivorans]